MRAYFALPLLALLTLQAHAFVRGPYVEGNFGQSYAYVDDIPGTVDSQNAFAWNANIGYQFDEYLSFEAGYNSYAAADITQGKQTGSDNRYGIDVTSKLIWPYRDTFNFFSKLGLTQMYSDLDSNLSRDNNKDNDQDFVSFYLSVGSAYHVTNWFDLNFQYSYIPGSGDIGATSLASLGATLFIGKHCL
jgi:hypothetical protein